MATTTEEQIRKEQEGWEAEQQENEPDEAEPAGEADDGLFDKSIYEREELQLPKVDGEPTDKIGIKFSGTVLLDRSDPADVALMRGMRLGQDVTLMVEAKCAGKGHRYTTSRDGELDAIVLEHGARVHTVYRPAGE